ncbi:MAG: ribonuclease P protein component [Prolixibacteraceae bacterium]|nr:ribonuclease P protein component [Prolixibacteraceae bacterium]
MEKSPQNSDSKIRRFTFKKQGRLCSKKVIDKLFSEGVSFLSFPIKIIILQTELPAGNNVQAGFSVSKKKFKKAVQRNLIKRRMREAYRLNQHLLQDSGNGNSLAIFFIYIGNEIFDYKTIEQAMKKALIKCSKMNSPEK